MKTIRRFPIAIAVSMLVFMGACEQQGVTDHNEHPVQEYAEFEQALNKILENAGNRLRAERAGREDIEAVFRSAYEEVFQDEAMIDVFNANAVSVPHRHKQRTGPTQAQLIVQNAGSPEKALVKINAALADETLEESEILDLIIVRQSIGFMDTNHDLLEPGERITFRLEEDEEEDDKEEPEERLSWWESWGKCAAGTIGGAGLGCLGGCATGAIPTVGFGCPAGCAAGTIAGALKGASSAC